MKIVGLAAYIGSGKSTLSQMLGGDYNVISKADLDPSSPDEMYHKFVEDRLYLVKKAVERLNNNKPNIIDPITTPLEHDFLKQFDCSLVFIWRNRLDRKASILRGRAVPSKFDEPKNSDEFDNLDAIVSNYMLESGNLFRDANHVLVNNGTIQDLYAQFRGLRL
jgi:dephospho-CoA kinase